MLFFFLWVMWFALVIQIVVDIFRNDDLNGWRKALWLLFILVLPFLGVLVYVISQGSGMSRRSSMGRMSGLRGRPVGAPSVTSADELERLAELHRTGALTGAEYAQAKHQVLPM
ncbi:SHOCT domain-containing protein [Streptomyces kanamyceticus]|uniref:SHOCT domain-containing protein n=2 Tax=Streptomyces kanamyceticus TaxID=1967 RepID=A0A5J6GWV1_STRKN|nr:SHOCT domain-containing protein [Streptomyces kanamyceticus]